jgi:hypothetical protein
MNNQTNVYTKTPANTKINNKDNVHIPPTQTTTPNIKLVLRHRQKYSVLNTKKNHKQVGRHTDLRQNASEILEIQKHGRNTGIDLRSLIIRTHAMMPPLSPLNSSSQTKAPPTFCPKRKNNEWSTTFKRTRQNAQTRIQIPLANPYSLLDLDHTGTIDDNSNQNPQHTYKPSLLEWSTTTHRTKPSATQPHYQTLVSNLALLENPETHPLALMHAQVSMTASTTNQPKPLTIKSLKNTTSHTSPNERYHARAATLAI